MPNLPIRKNKYHPRGPKKNTLCPFGHEWTRLSGKMGYCDHEDCQVAFVCDNNYNKTYFSMSEGLVELLEGTITVEEIIEREKIRYGNSRC